MARADGRWNVVISPPYPGFAPGYWRNALISNGNKNHASAMVDVDMTDPTMMTQGPGLATLTNGDENAAVSTLIDHVMPIPAGSADLAFGVGGALFYRLSATTVTNGSADSITWPYTINHPGQTGEDALRTIYYNKKVYVLYNYTGGGDIAQYNLAGTIDDDWGSTTPGTGAAALQNAPHPAVVGGDDVLYFGNDNSVGYYDHVADTMSVDDLDLPEGTQVVDVRWQDNVLWVAANYPNLTGSNANIGTIRVWRGVGSPSWEDQPFVELRGTIGALYPKDGRMYVWYQDLTGVSSGGYKLGVVVGNKVQQLRAYSGTLPNDAQITEYQNCLMWVSSGKLELYGAIDDLLPPFHSVHADGGHATVGALAAPFGTPLVASTDGASAFKLAKFSGLSVLSTWKSINFRAPDSIIDEVEVHYTSGGTGARCDITISYDQAGSSTLLQQRGQTGSLTETNDSGQTRKIFPLGQQVQDFRVDLDWTNGSATNGMEIREIIIRGHQSQRA